MKNFNEGAPYAYRRVGNNIWDASGHSIDFEKKKKALINDKITMFENILGKSKYLIDDKNAMKSLMLLATSIDDALYESKSYDNILDLLKSSEDLILIYNLGVEHVYSFIKNPGVEVVFYDNDRNNIGECSIKFVSIGIKPIFVKLIDNKVVWYSVDSEMVNSRSNYHYYKGPLDAIESFAKKVHWTEKN